MPAAPATSSGSCQPETAACTRTAAARYPTKAASALPVARHVRERSRRVRAPATRSADRRDQQRGHEQDPDGAAPAEGERGAAERERGHERHDVLRRDGRDPVDGRAADEHDARRRRPDPAGQVAQHLRAAPHAHVLARRVTGGEDRPAAREQRPPQERARERRGEQPPRQRAEGHVADGDDEHRRDEDHGEREPRDPQRGEERLEPRARARDQLTPGGAPAPRSSGSRGRSASRRGGCGPSCSGPPCACAS